MINLGLETWSSVEEPTFIIPKSISLNKDHLDELERLNIKLGEPFSLDTYGNFIKPEYKTLRIKTSNSLVTINDIKFIELNTDIYSLTMNYSSFDFLKLTITFFAKCSKLNISK